MIGIELVVVISCLVVAFRLINSSPTHYASVSSLAVFYHFFHDYCFSERVNYMPPTLLQSCCTKLYLLLLPPLFCSPY